MIPWYNFKEMRFVNSTLITNASAKALYIIIIVYSGILKCTKQGIEAIRITTTTHHDIILYNSNTHVHLLHNIDALIIKHNTPKNFNHINNRFQVKTICMFINVLFFH